MGWSSRSTLFVCVVLANGALAEIKPDFHVSGDGTLLEVSFRNGNQLCKYNLVSRSTYAVDAKIIVHSDKGTQRRLPPASRMFTSPGQDIWAAAFLEDGNDASQVHVSGLFICEGVLIDIPSIHDGVRDKHAKLAPLRDHFESARSSSSNRPHRQLRDRQLAGTVSSQANETYDPDIPTIANETDGWKVPELPQGDSDFMSGWFTKTSTHSWSGEKWFPGCYDGDSELHVLKIGIVVDVAATKKHGTRLNDLIESTVGKASLIYESQLNIKLEIADLQIYESSNKAPDYAGDDCPDIYTQLDRMVAGAKLSGGVVHLLSGCGNGYGVVGLAYMSTMCGRSHHYGVNQLHNSMSWITFAHEVGHNFGGDHSFEEGQGKTGGIMDYGDGKLDDEYQFNTKYRKQEMCAVVDRKVNSCNGNFYLCDAACRDDVITNASSPAGPFWALAMALVVLHWRLCR